ncbi:MFS transporter [Novosphingobium sp. FSY-8]|uniref:MFS transporter n=2 Tax=Novosphingobium ovatum TaxID=1908523 RepID=A0ABW9XBW8_9SPHN|nr:MFS transporter [Novosphingobium ovatum]
MVGVALGLSPLPFYTIGMFAPELAKAFGWSFTALMGSVGVQSLVVMASGPAAGFLLDRWGARRVALWSLGLFGLCFMSLGLATGNLWFYYGQWVVMSIVGAGTLSATWTRVVNGWFDRHRGLALGVASTGTGLTGFLIKPFSAWLIGEFGWRVAFGVVGALPIIIGIPIVAWLLREPPVAGVAGADVDAAPADDTGLTLAQAVRSRGFWVMAGAFLLIAFALTAPTPNMENILKTKGFARMDIASITAAFGLAVIAGRLIGGWLLDRFWAPGCALAVLMVPALGSFLLSHTGVTHPQALFAVVCLGLGAGFEFDLLAYLIARYFGRRNYGTIYGCFYTVIALGGGLGPVVYGRAFDVTGGYGAVLLGGVGCLILGGLLLLPLGPYPRFGGEGEAD